VTVLPEQELKVGIGGFGAIGRRVAQALDAGIPGLRLAAVSARGIAKAEQGMRAFARPVPIVPLADLAAASDIVIDAAPAAALRDMAEPALRAGRYLIVISVGALLQATDLIELARRHRAQIIVPSGALIGLDAVTAAAEGKINSVRMISRKPVQGLLGAAYLQTAGIDIAGIKEPLKVFSGTAAQAAIGFPENLNVAAALGLAGVGAERTMIEVWADPALTRNTHRIEVDADSASFSMTIENIPSENPKTGRITALSIIATLRKLTSPLRVGT
jgi:aspartate dehydrogenase